MRTETLANGRPAEDIMSNLLAHCRHLLEKLNTFFNNTQESDWEKKISKNWREWGRPT